ncbi:sensor histidine kinase [Mesorhizobium loti]|nr:sensor histidine kinase [Mesorhizobium loti]
MPGGGGSGLDFDRGTGGGAPLSGCRVSSGRSRRPTSGSYRVLQVVQCTLAHGLHAEVTDTELATNAIKYAFPKGAGRITLGFQRRDGEVTLAVEDNGIGMNPASAETGMGSRFMNAFAQQFGGTLAKASAGTGTTFIVRLPLTVLAGNESSAVS